MTAFSNISVLSATPRKKSLSSPGDHAFGCFKGVGSLTNQNKLIEKFLVSRACNSSWTSSEVYYYITLLK